MSPALQADSLPIDPSGKACIRAWRIPWTEEPEKLQSRGSQELDITEVTPHARKIKMGLFTLAKLNLQKSRKNPAYKPYCKVL